MDPCQLKSVQKALHSNENLNPLEQILLSLSGNDLTTQYIPETTIRPKTTKLTFSQFNSIQSEDGVTAKIRMKFPNLENKSSLVQLNYVDFHFLSTDFSMAEIAWKFFKT